MSDDFSARLALPYLAAGQMQKHVTLNTALTRLDALSQTAVVSRSVAVQPIAAADGDLYILPEAASGAAWAGRGGGDLMRYEAGGWSAVPAPEGMIAVVLDAGEAVVRADGGWTPLADWLGASDELSVSRLGINTTADAANPFAAKVNKLLFTALGAGEGGDGDLRMTLNKESAADVLSLLFQSGYGGRAELGLVGDDDLSLKVSPDGGTWRTALKVERATGRILFDQGATRSETTVFTVNGAYTPPAWARWIEAICIGGGGGGGSGMSGAAGSSRFGGGASGISEARWPVEALAGNLTIEVGAAGDGGAAGSAGGQSGDAGDASRVRLDGQILLQAHGGGGGSGGSASSGAGGIGGGGVQSANGGGASSITTTGGAGASTVLPSGAGGGGAGGGLNTSNVARPGGAGGPGARTGIPTGGGSGGAGAGSDGQASPLPDLSPLGGGGGGGGAAASGAGWPGGTGGGFGAGGGGGGAGLSLSGAGGNGAPGLVRITAIG